MDSCFQNGPYDESRHEPYHDHPNPQSDAQDPRTHPSTGLLTDMLRHTSSTTASSTTASSATVPSTTVPSTTVPSTTGISANARAAVVNRTHRIVRERAEAMQARRKSARDLVVPLVICSALLLMVCYAVGTVVSNTFGFAAVGNEIEEAGKLLNAQAMDSGGPVYLLLMWFLPVSLFTLATVLFRRFRSRAESGATR